VKRAKPTPPICKNNISSVKKFNHFTSPAKKKNKLKETIIGQGLGLTKWKG